MNRAERLLPKHDATRKYSVEAPPIEEFDAEPKTQPIPPCTMAQLVQS